MSTPRIACVACLTLAAALNAAPVATFEYTNVANFDDYTIFNEDVASNQSVGSILLTGVLTQLTPQSPAWDATVSVVAPDGQFLVIRPFPLTNDFSTLELSSVRSVIQTVVGNAQGPWIIALREDFGDLSPDVADSQWNSLQIQLDTVGIGEPPPCPNGLGSVTLTNVVSNGTSASPGATRTIDFGIPGTINSIAISGLVTADNISRLSDARLRLIAPSGNTYEVLADLGLPVASGPYVLENFELGLLEPEPGTGTWNLEFFELFDEPSITDATWQALCVAIDRVASDPSVRVVADPPFLAAGGSGTPITLKAYVTPGSAPLSTFDGSGSITADASEIGAGTLTFRDDGAGADEVAHDNVFTASAAAIYAAASGYRVPVSLVDDHGRIASDEILLPSVEPTPTCAPGDDVYMLLDLAALEELYGPGNSRTTFDSSLDLVTTITLYGRVAIYPQPTPSDAAIAVTAPSGRTTHWFVGGDFAAMLVEDVNVTMTLDEPEPAQGTWTIEAYQTVDHYNVGPESLWFNTCIKLESIGACCTSNGCAITSSLACEASGGTFQGPGTNCGTPTYTNDSSSLSFEEIRALGDLLNISNADDATQPVQIGFDFNFMGNVYSSVNVSTNGNIQFGNNPSALNVNFPIPTAAAPNNMIVPLWNDFNPAAGGGIYTLSDTSGGAGNGRFIVSWEDVPRYLFNDSNSFQVILHESGSFEFRYGPISPEGVPGDFTVGYESINGTSGVSIPGGSIGAGNTARSFSFIPGPSPCAGGACAACPADYDQDGGVTGGDVAAFIPDFEQGETCADVDGDGGVTGGDLATFFQFFEAGGC